VEGVVLFEAADSVGGQLTPAAAAPHRTGWAALLSFYERGLAAAGVDLRLDHTAGRVSDLDQFDAVVLATGAEETSPLMNAGATASSIAIAQGTSALAGAAHVVVVDDGFGWWPGCNVVELAVLAGVARITFLSPGMAFAGGIPAESRVQLLQRLAAAACELEIMPLCTAVDVGSQGITVAHRTSGRTSILAGDRVVVVGERGARMAPDCNAPLVLAIGDSIGPRRVAHGIAEGRAAAVRIAATL
jgi:2,4-dienoyl-CoA reductase (NADPH2)